MSSPDQPVLDQAGRPFARRRRWYRAAILLIVVLVVFVAATARLLVWPAQGMPTRVDAIVVLGGPGNRLGKGLELWHQRRASVIVISLGLPITVPRSLCAPHVRPATSFCFAPGNQGTTQTEAEDVARLAKQHHWHSMVLVTSPEQDTRARLRFKRCYPGRLYVVTTPLPLTQWPYFIAYEWGGLFKALVLQPSC
jgi:uncharacterized SAM-binding protein YcdF (DUF218 family)